MAPSNQKPDKQERKQMIRIGNICFAIALAFSIGSAKQDRLVNTLRPHCRVEPQRRATLKSKFVRVPQVPLPDLAFNGKPQQILRYMAGVT